MPKSEFPKHLKLSRVAKDQLAMFEAGLNRLGISEATDALLQTQYNAAKKNFEIAEHRLNANREAALLRPKHAPHPLENAGVFAAVIAHIRDDDEQAAIEQLFALTRCSRTLLGFYRDIIAGRATFISIRDSEGLFLRIVTSPPLPSWEQYKIIYMPIKARDRRREQIQVGRFDRSAPVGIDYNRNVYYMVAPYRMCAVDNLLPPKGYTRAFVRCHGEMLEDEFDAGCDHIKTLHYQ